MTDEKLPKPFGLGGELNFNDQVDSVMEQESYKTIRQISELLEMPGYPARTIANIKMLIMGWERKRTAIVEASVDGFATKKEGGEPN